MVEQKATTAGWETAPAGGGWARGRAVALGWAGSGWPVQESVLASDAAWGVVRQTRVSLHAARVGAKAVVLGS